MLHLLSGITFLLHLRMGCILHILNIKYNMAAGYPQDQEDLDLLKEIALLMGSTVTVSSDDTSIDDEEYNTWMDEVDTSVIH